MNCCNFVKQSRSKVSDLCFDNRDTSLSKMIVSRVGKWKYFLLENCKSKVSKHSKKIFSWLDLPSFWRLKPLLYNNLLKFFSLLFCWTSGFFEFLSFNSNVQSLIKRWKRNHIASSKGSSWREDCFITGILLRKESMTVWRINIEFFFETRRKQIKDHRYNERVEAKFYENSLLFITDRKERQRRQDIGDDAQERKCWCKRFWNVLLNCAGAHDEDDHSPRCR